MRKKNCNCTYTKSRNESLQRAYLENFSRLKSLDATCQLLAQMPAERFYIDEERAYLLLRKNRKPSLPNKVTMLSEIESRVLAAMARDSSLSMREAVYAVVNSPAPSFYLSPLTIKTILYLLWKRQ